MTGKGPIIIVDDDPDDQALVVTTLQELGYRQEVKLFSDGTEALDYLKLTSDNPFIILCDIQMPRMGGIELKERIEQNEALRKKSIPFVYITGSAISADVVTAFNLSVQGFFIKPNLLEGWHDLIKVIFHYWEESVHPKTLSRTDK